MKKRTLTFPALGAGVILAIAVLGLSRRADPAPAVQGHFRPEDVSQIQKAVRRDRWEITKACFTHGKFKLLFSVCILDSAFGRIREVGSIPDRASMGPSASLPNPSSRAYVLSGGWYSRKGVKYGLERTTNGWEVTSFGYQQ